MGEGDDYQPSGEGHTLTGRFRLHGAVASRFLKTPTRRVLVYLPPGYVESPGRRYPVFYLHDGQNLFDGATSFIAGQEWRCDETAEELIRARLIAPVILVGIDNGGAARLDEYTPTRDVRLRGGFADDYGRFLTDELKPLIDKTYRTRTGPEDTALGGSSLGGLVSLHLGLTRPDVFGKIAALSPSVWWDAKAIVKRVEALPRKLRLTLWVDMGAAEGYTALPDARQLRDALISKGWREGRDLTYLEAEGAAHNEAAWAARFDRVLMALFR